MKHKQTIAEVSGAIEVEPEVLAVIERGQNRPDEEILALLISYFNIKDEEADKLWQLAGYDDVASAKMPVFVLPEDLKVVYTDIANIMVNEFGVVLNFLQTVGPNIQPLAIARVGMSREHAMKVLEMLQKVLEPKPLAALPAPAKPPQKLSD